MVEYKTIGVMFLIVSGVFGAGIFADKTFFDKPKYYCESRTDIGIKSCDTLSKYGVENGKCVVDGTGFICKTGWTLIKNDVPINKEQTETLTYQCKPSGCEV